MWRLLVLGSLLVLAAAFGYEAAVALHLLSIGDEPGEGPTGEGVLLAAAIGALLAGALVASRPDTSARLLLPLLPLVGAAFALARFYAYDPYYAPTLRRASEGGLVAGTWILVLVVLALLAAAVTTIRPRLGRALIPVVLLVTAFTALVVRSGH